MRSRDEVLREFATKWSADELDDMVDAAVESLAASAAKSFRDGHPFVPSPSDVRKAIGSALVALATRPTTPTRGSDE